MVPLSILDLVPVVQGSTPREALHRSLDLAQHAERLGYTRYWVAEHHNMAGIASAATSVVIGYLAGGTKTIRVGAGGIMLPNHSPLQIAEQFGTLESLYPGRIDLGLGRAPGTDQLTVRAMRRDPRASDDFPQDVQELQALFAPVQRRASASRPCPGAGLRVPLWILGSSLFGAQLAAFLGLPYAFASHFAPAALNDALPIYRQKFEPSEQLERPYAMAGRERHRRRDRRRSASPLHDAAAGVHRPASRHARPAEAADRRHRCVLDAGREARRVEHAHAFDRRLPETVRAGLERFVAQTKADELMVVTSVFDHDARKRSYEILAELRG